MRGEHPAYKPWEKPFVAFAHGFNRGFDRLAHGYSNLTRRLVRTVAIMLLLYVGLLALTGWRLGATPQGFIRPRTRA